MKEESIFKIAQRGSSILEVLIALAVLTLGISSAAMLAFANQTLRLDSDTSGEALYKAKDVLESARARARENFNAVVSLAPVMDDIYAKDFVITDVTPCSKEAMSRVSWATEPSRPQKIELLTDLSDVAGAVALGGDCESFPPASEWRNPTTLATAEIQPSGNQGTGIDLQKINGKKYAFLSSKMSSAGKDDFWAIDVEVNPPVIVSSLDTTDAGLNAIDTARNSTNGKTYAYLANDDALNQFQVVDITDPASPALIASRTLPGVTGSCPFTCPGGRSIFYYNNKVYIGTHRLVGALRHEFHIYDVSNPASPVWRGSFKLDHNVNAIALRGTTAYLATSADTKELIMLDVSDPAAISETDRFDAKAITGNPSDEDGTSLYLIGNKLYLGRDRASNANERDFYILDVNNLSSPLGSARLGMNPNTTVTDMVISGELAFLATSDSNAGFQVWSISDPTNIQMRSLFNYSEKASGIEFMDDTVYISNLSQNALRVIAPTQCSNAKDDEGDSKIDAADPQCHSDSNANNSASYQPNDNDETN